MSLGGQPDTSQVFIGRIYANTPINGKYHVRPDTTNTYVNYTTAYHTHLTRMGPLQERIIPSRRDYGAKLKQKSLGITKFIILTDSARVEY